MRCRALENLYEQFYCNRLLIEKPSLPSKKEVAAKIADRDPNLSVGSLRKDVRIQPTGPFDASNFTKTITDAGYEVVNILMPGEKGSTSDQLRTYIIRDTNGNEYPVVLGKGKGFGTKDEDLVLGSLKQQLKTILSEASADYIFIDINGDKQKVDDILSTPGVPKSDFNFTYKGVPVLFISHKAGHRANNYQQYGGTTCKSGEKICQHPEVVEFISQVREKYKGIMPPGESMWKYIRDERLQKLSVFGKDYTDKDKKYGINNVHASYQGSIKIIQNKNDTYALTSHYTVYNGEVPIGDYTPVLLARYSHSRGGNHGIADMRSSISPIAKVAIKRRNQNISSDNSKEFITTDQSIEQSLSEI